MSKFPWRPYMSLPKNFTWHGFRYSRCQTCGTYLVARHARYNWVCEECVERKRSEMYMDVATKSQVIEVIQTTITYDGMTHVQYWDFDGNHLANNVFPVKKEDGSEG